MNYLTVNPKIARLVSLFLFGMALILTSPIVNDVCTIPGVTGCTG